MSNKYFLVFLVFLFSVSAYSQRGHHRNSLISGRVMSTEKVSTHCTAIIPTKVL